MKEKDWVGDTNSIFKTLGASSHAQEERENNDFYATDPKAAELLLQLETFDNNIWECACGMGHLSKVFEKAGHNVKSSDIVNRGYGTIEDFLSMNNKQWNGDIITNPPYKYAQEFIEKALRIIPNGKKVGMFLKVQFLEGKERKKLFLKYPPKVIYISSSRMNCAKNANFAKYESSAIAYAWFIWEKGFTGDTIVKWFN